MRPPGLCRKLQIFDRRCYVWFLGGFSGKEGVGVFQVESDGQFLSCWCLLSFTTLSKIVGKTFATAMT